MAFTKEKKESLVKEFQRKERDTGSPEVQVALLTERINYLTEHSKVHKKDNHSRFGLLKLVAQRKSLLSYLKRKNLDSYKALIKKLNLRK